MNESINSQEQQSQEGLPIITTGITKKCVSEKCESPENSEMFSRFCLERFFFIGALFLFGGLLALASQNIAIFFWLGPGTAFLYGFANYWTGVGGLTETFLSNEIEDWMKKRFSWTRFAMEGVYFVGVIIAAALAFGGICLVIFILRLFSS